MIFVRPDFYDDFACIASRCRHSCCVGWEIDIDSDALARWETIGGALGEKMRRSIAREPAPHFVLTKGERCPLLRADGLCELILSEGEDSLCDICASHPRFYQEYPDRLEAGLGLCCEEAVRLLLAETGPLRLTADGDEGDALSPTPLLRQRGKLFAILADEAACLSDRMACCLSRYGRVLTPFDPRAAADFLLTLERMDEAWTALLVRLAAEGTAELDLCSVAEGRAVIFFEAKLQPWDYAAGSLIVKEAGGGVMDWNGRPLEIGTASSVVAYGSGVTGIWDQTDSGQTVWFAKVGETT